MVTGSVDSRSANAPQRDRLRALAHPLRLRILEAIRTDGPLTATNVSEALSQSVSNCSFHLRILAKSGLIEQAPGRNRRERPWQAASTSFHIDPSVGDPDERQLAQAAVRTLRDSDRASLENWDQVRERASTDWRDAAFEKTTQLRLTAAQLTALRQSIELAIESLEDIAGDGSVKELVQLQLIGYPARAIWE